MSVTPDPKAHQLLGGLAQQASYVHEFAKAGQQQEALEHAGAVDRLITDWRNAADPNTSVATREGLEELVQQLADPDPCWFDHHGYCQAHGWFYTDPACPNGRAQALFPDIKEN